MLKNDLSENMRTASKDLSAASIKTAFPNRKGKEEAASPQKGSQPRLAALGSPFQRKGLAWTLPPSYGRRCPEGAEVGWGSGMKESEEMHLKSTINESTLSIADAVLSSLRETGRGIHFSFTNFHLSMI